MKANRAILVDFFPLRGHSVLFDNTYNILSNNMEILSLVPEDYAGGITNAIKTPYRYYQEYKGNRFLRSFRYIKYCLYTISFIIQYAKRNNVDKVICMTYEELSLALYSLFMPCNIELYIMHHNNIDHYCSSKFRKMAFLIFRDKVFHIVQCGFMAKVLYENLNVKHIVVWPHPLNQMPDSSTKDIQYACVGLSASNDQSIIEYLIELEKKEKIFMNNNLKIVLKSKGDSFDDGYLKVVNTYIPTEEFIYYINHSKSILIPFPKSFNYRMSGSLMDALTNNKYIIATDIPVIKECKSSYPNLIYIYNKNSFIEDLKRIMSLEKLSEEFVEFQRYHSSENLGKIYHNNLMNKDDIGYSHNNYDF